MRYEIEFDIPDVIRMVKEMQDTDYVEELVTASIQLLHDQTDGRQDFEECLFACYQQVTGSGLDFL